jgi:hypothetical protein
MTSPLVNSGIYPCKVRLLCLLIRPRMKASSADARGDAPPSSQGYLGTADQGPRPSWTAGETVKVSLAGTAVHGGGCKSASHLAWTAALDRGTYQAPALSRARAGGGRRAAAQRGRAFISSLPESPPPLFLSLIRRHPVVRIALLSLRTLTWPVLPRSSACQFGLSYDNGNNFFVIKSFMGGCPSVTSAFDVEIPANAPTGDGVMCVPSPSCPDAREPSRDN